VDEDTKSLEEQADDLLIKDAKCRGTTLYREGIIDERRRRLIQRREMPLSQWEHERRKER
jgi:hypothetical protein